MSSPEPGPPGRDWRRDLSLDWRRELPQWLLLGGMWLLAALTWPTAPERLPVHWNLAGEVDRYGSKAEALLLVPALALGVYLLLLLLPLADPARASYALFARAYALIRLAVLVVLAGLYGLVHLWLRGWQVDVGATVAVLVGGLLLVVGAVLGQVRPNWLVGVRTPWTLTSRRTWEQTHRVGGRVFVALGALTIVAGLLWPRWAIALMLALTLAGSLGLVVYSYLVWRTAPDRGGPPGS